MSAELQTEYCEFCRIGRCHPTTAPYIYWVEKQVMVLPNAPALSCDVCGELQYDSDFLKTLDIILQELEYGLPMKETIRQPHAAKRPSTLQPPRLR